MPNLLHIKNLTVKTIKGAVLVDNISLQVRKGETVVLLGQSGSGKTMTSLAVMDLLPAGVVKESGDILLAGRPFTTDMRGETVSMIMQSPAACFDQVFTIRTQFTDILKFHGKTELCNDVYFCELISSVELESPLEILRAYPFQLSGGMLQRLMIALAVSLETPLIIADEPTSDLDLPGQAEILKLIQKLSTPGKGMLMITHDISVALSMADRILVMNRGRLVDCFNAEDIDAPERDGYTRSLMAANNILFVNPWKLNMGGAHA